MRLTDKLINFGKKIAVGASLVSLLALGAPKKADSIPSIYFVPEKTQVQTGETSYFDVYINSDGKFINCMDAPIGYSNNILEIYNA